MSRAYDNISFRVLSSAQKKRLRALLGSRRSLDQAGGSSLAAQAKAPLREVEAFALSLGITPKRYERNLGTLGRDGQSRLLAAKVLVVGLGGLGGHVVEMLARLGVGRITGVDGDSFDETNLNRQIFADLENLGRPKAEVARERVRCINPAVEFTPHAARLETLGPGMLRGCGLAFDCLDSIPSRLALAALCSRARVTMVHGAIAGWCGQVGVCPPGGDLFRKLYGEATGPRGMETELGNLPMTAAVAANLMVAAGLPLLLGKPAPRRSLRFFDLLEGNL